jgi:hypothetical protein
MNINTLRLCEYFDGVKHDVDIRTELYTHSINNIENNDHDRIIFDEANALRETCIREISACEAYNVSRLVNSQADLVQPEEKIFQKFCFVVDTNSARFGWRLVLTNTYLTPIEVSCFQGLMRRGTEWNFYFF